MKALVVAAFALLLSAVAYTSPFVLQGIYPTHWWTGMKNPRVQLMIRGFNASDLKISIAYPGVKVEKITKAKNSNYHFVDLYISPAAKPGMVTIRFTTPEGSGTVPYQLKARSKENGKTRIRGVDASDFIYLIMPDRFSNGDPSNDRLPGFRDTTLNRNEIFHRHGGDLKGIENHLDYLQDLAVTARWLNPVIENDMPQRSEHGYAITDHYTTAPRPGGQT